jgi:hypothetical protein
MFPNPVFEDSKPTEPLVELLALLKVAHDGTPAGIGDATQTHWRKPAVHTGDIKDEHPELRDRVVPLLEQLGFLGQRKPKRQHYTYWCVGGAYELAIKKRFLLAKQVWEGGARFLRDFVLLGGKRPRHPEKETLVKLLTPIDGLPLRPNGPQALEAPATEDLIMQALLTLYDVPLEWRESGVLVQTPLRTDRLEKPDPSGEDTIRHWLMAHKPEPGSCLLFSSQPSVMSFWAAASKILEPLGFEVEVVGYAAPTANLNVSQALDAVAKVIYEFVP